MSYRRLLYSIALSLLFPLVIARLLWKSRKNDAYRKRIAERLGYVNLQQNAQNSLPIIWLHAVSVGETQAAKPLIQGLIEKYPDHKILVTSTTPTGSAMVTKLFPSQVEHVYFPYDLPWVIHRFLERVHPRILVIMETEIWPNLYAACKKRGIPLMIANARLSRRSTKGYTKIKGLIAETLQNLDSIAVRSIEDAENFQQLGASQQQIKISGNIKFDVDLDQQQIEKGRIRKNQWGNNRPVWVAASTHDNEEQQVFGVYSQLIKSIPELLLILVPRHQERFDEVNSLLQNATQFYSVRHSQQQDYLPIESKEPINIILGDTMGEMQSWFATADVVFMGGSLVNTGGHNPLDAVALGTPVLSGTHVFNFEDIYPQLFEEGLCGICKDSVQLQQQLFELIKQGDDPGFQEKANRLMKSFRGVTQRLLIQVDKLLKKV